jgi:hypothetical protein
MKPNDTAAFLLPICVLGLLSIVGLAIARLIGL